jgi:hypothetical protein
MQSIRAAEIADFRGFERALRFFSRSSWNHNTVIVFTIMNASTSIYPQSYISKLWRAGYKDGVMTTLLQVQVHEQTMNEAYILTRSLAKALTNINISFNRDTVSKRHCHELRNILSFLTGDA